MPLTLEEKKSYKTIGGLKVDIRNIDPRQIFPVVGEVFTAKDSKSHLMYFTLDGRAAHHDFKYDISALWTGWE